MRSGGSKPVSRPVERAEKRARRNRRIDGAELAAPDAGGEERADAALVAIALGDDQVPQRGRQRVHFQMRRRSFELVDEAPNVRERERPQPVGEGAAGAPSLGERRGEPIERAILAEEENLVLAPEIVVEVRRGQIGRDGDVAHPGGGVAARAEDARGRAQNVDAAGLGADRTAVR